MKKNLLKLLALSAMIGSTLVACNRGDGNKGKDDYEDVTLASVVELDSETFEPVMKGKKVRVSKGYHYEAYDGNKFILSDTTWSDFDSSGSPTSYDENYGVEVVLADGNSDVVDDDGASAFGTYVDVTGEVAVSDDGRTQIINAAVQFHDGGTYDDNYIGYFLYGSPTSSDAFDSYVARDTVGYHLKLAATIQSAPSYTQADGGSFTFSIYGEEVTEYNVYTCYIPGNLSAAEYSAYQTYANFQAGHSYNMYVSAYWSDGAAAMLMPTQTKASRISEIESINTFAEAWAEVTDASTGITAYPNTYADSSVTLVDMDSIDLSDMTVLDDANPSYIVTHNGCYYVSSDHTWLADIWTVKANASYDEAIIDSVDAYFTGKEYTVDATGTSSWDGETGVSAVVLGGDMNNDGAELDVEYYYDSGSVVMQFFYYFYGGAAE